VDVNVKNNGPTDLEDRQFTKQVSSSLIDKLLESTPNISDKFRESKNSGSKVDFKQFYESNKTQSVDYGSNKPNIDKIESLKKKEMQNL